jgi:hypothetical protein
MGSETFELTRFGWATPDTLEIDGRFAGLDDGAAGDAVLVLRGGDRTHRLAAVTNGDSAAVADRGEWHAAFAWEEAPTAFDFAQLELGEDLLVDLPAPRPDADGSDPEVLDVRHRSGSARLRLQVDLLAAQSLLGEMEARLSRSEQDLARARDDLAAEQGDRAADAERFRTALAQTRETAEEEVAAARADAAALRARAEELEGAGEEAERLRGRMAQIREIVEDGAPRAQRGVGGDAAKK